MEGLQGCKSVAGAAAAIALSAGWAGYVWGLGCGAGVIIIRVHLEPRCSGTAGRGAEAMVGGGTRGRWAL